MKRFLKNIVLFVLILFGIQLLSYLFVNPFWGNDVFNNKFRYYQKNSDKFNTIVLGSSRLNKGVNPALLDSLLRDYDLKTYNLSSPATVNPEVYFQYENLLHSGNPLPKYVFIELVPLNSIVLEKMELNIPRFYYWQNLKYFNFVVKYIFSSNYDFSLKTKLLGIYFNSQIIKYSSFSHFKFIFDQNKGRKSKFSRKDNNGFEAIDDEFLELKDKKEQRKRNFLKDTTVVSEIVSSLKGEFSNPYHSMSFNFFHYKFLMELIETSDKKGVHVIYFVPPRSKTYLEELALLEKLPGKNVIIIADPDKYPEFYMVKYTFDRSHLNKNGANILTTCLAKEFKSKVPIDQH